jgi:hypothetical protein
MYASPRFAATRHLVAKAHLILDQAAAVPNLEDLR